MAVMEESIVINRPRREVFEFIVTPENMFLWISKLIEYERLTEGPLRKGSLTRARLKIVGRTVETTVETYEFEEAERWTSRSIESPIEVEVGTRLEDANGGTRVTFHQEIGEIPGGFFGKLAEPLVVRMIQKDMRVSTEKLKELVEAE
jgi:uncharacterized protein YndB with AHSA1/START domain